MLRDIDSEADKLIELLEIDKQATHEQKVIMLLEGIAEIRKGEMADDVFNKLMGNFKKGKYDKQ